MQLAPVAVQRLLSPLALVHGVIQEVAPCSFQTSLGVIQPPTCQRCVDPGNLVLWQRAETTSELARLAYVLLGPRLTTVYIALVLVYSNGGLLALGGTDRVLIEYTTKISDPPTIPLETTCSARTTR